MRLDFSPSAGYQCVIHKLLNIEYYTSIKKNEVEICVEIWKDVQNKSGEKAEEKKK